MCWLGLPSGGMAMSQEQMEGKWQVSAWGSADALPPQNVFWHVS